MRYEYVLREAGAAGTHKVGWVIPPCLQHQDAVEESIDLP